MAESASDRITPSATSKRQPLAYFRVNLAKVLTSPGMADAFAAPRLFGIVWRLAMKLWVSGPLPIEQLAPLGRCSPDDINELVTLGIVAPIGDGLSIPWLEDERTELDQYRLDQAARANKRWDATACRGNAKAMRGYAGAMPVEERRVEKNRLTPSDPSGPQLCPGADAPGSAHGETKPQTKPASTKEKPNPKKGDHVQIVETFQRAWAEYRHEDLLANLGVVIDRSTDPATIPPAARYLPRTLDWVAADKLWKETNGDMRLIRQRMSNLFESTAQWVVQSASVALLHSKFSMFEHAISDLRTEKAS